MKVLHLIPYMHPAAGGPPVVVDHWCQELSRRGHHARVLTTNAYDDGDPEWKSTISSRYEVTILDKMGPKGFGFASRMRNQLRCFLQNVDLVHVHNLWGYTNLIAAKECGSHRVPWLVSPHGMADPNSVSRKRWKKMLYGSLLEWPALRKANGLVFTHAEEERLARRSCTGLPRGFVVSLGTDEPPAERHSLAEQFFEYFPGLRGARMVLFLSRLHAKKGLDLLLPAFARVVARHPDAKLVLVGPGDPAYVQQLKQVTQSLQLEDKVLFIGPLLGDMKWAALAAATLYVLPSYQENFAIALVEAMRIGTPTICSKRVNIWDDLSAAGATQICELSESSIAEQINSLLEQPEVAASLAICGSEYAAEHFTWSKSADQLIEVYEAVLATAKL